MICIHCGNSKTSVTNSRPHKKRPSVWRRRSCAKCGAVFTTTEVIDVTDQMMVEDANGNIRRFSLPVLVLSISDSLAHRENQADDAFWLAQTIAEELYGAESETISPAVIGQTAYEVLDRYDPAAALQYGARHGILATTARRRTIRRRNS